MKKQIPLIIFIIIVSTLIVFTIVHSTNKSNRMESNLGKQVVIQNDTLTILNTNYNNEYTLSNGTKISSSIIEQFKIKE